MKKIFLATLSVLSAIFATSALSFDNDCGYLINIPPCVRADHNASVTINGPFQLNNYKSLNASIESFNYVSGGATAIIRLTGHNPGWPWAVLHAALKITCKTMTRIPNQITGQASWSTSDWGPTNNASIGYGSFGYHGLGGIDIYAGGYHNFHFQMSCEKVYVKR